MVIMFYRVSQNYSFANTTTFLNGIHCVAIFVAFLRLEPDGPWLLVAISSIFSSRLFLSFIFYILLYFPVILWRDDCYLSPHACPLLCFGCFSCCFWFCSFLTAELLLSITVQFHSMTISGPSVFFWLFLKRGLVSTLCILFVSYWIISFTRSQLIKFLASSYGALSCNLQMNVLGFLVCQSKSLNSVIFNNCDVAMTHLMYMLDNFKPCIYRAFVVWKELAREDSRFAFLILANELSAYRFAGGCSWFEHILYYVNSSLNAGFDSWTLGLKRVCNIFSRHVISSSHLSTK